MIVDGIMYYTASEVVNGAMLIGVLMGFAIFGVLMLFKNMFDV